MTLQGAQTFPKSITIPPVFGKKIKLLTNCKISDFEMTLFHAAILAMAEYIKNNNIDISGCDMFNVVFTKDGSFHFVENNDNIFGMQCQFAIYRMDKLRKCDLKMVVFVFIEELAHYFLQIYDETLIKYKVEEMMKDIFPSFTLDEIRGLNLYGL